MKKKKRDELLKEVKAIEVKRDNLLDRANRLETKRHSIYDRIHEEYVQAQLPKLEKKFAGKLCEASFWVGLVHSFVKIKYETFSFTITVNASYITQAADGTIRMGFRQEYELPIRELGDIRLARTGFVRNYNKAMLDVANASKCLEDHIKSQYHWQRHLNKRKK